MSITLSRSKGRRARSVSRRLILSSVAMLED